MTSRTAIVTGAARGIGAATARRLAADGNAVAVLDLLEDQARATAEAITADDGKAVAIGVDVADEVAVSAAVDRVAAELGAPTILVNNAAVTRDNLVLRMKDEEWQTVIDTNLAGVYRMSKAVLRGMMKARGGRIVSIASVVGQTGNAGQVNYAAAKAGLFGLTKSLAREVASRGITVNAVAPGFIDTDMTRELPADSREALLGQIPLARLGSAEDVAAAVRFLASPQAGYITGETLNVNGGLHMV